MATTTKAKKKALRRQMRRRLAAQDPEAAATAARRVAERVFALPELEAAEGVLTCLSFGHELETRTLADRLVASGRRVFVPRVVRGDGVLHVHPYPCRLERLSFGLEQPPAGEPEVPARELEAVIDVALVLGLAFDRRGMRLGYGGGYFDRFLAGRRIVPVGLGFDFQVLGRLPRERHDVPMARLVTPGATLLL